MTIYEIMKALEQHIERTKNLKYGARKKALVDAELLKDIFDLINRQQAENERLENGIEELNCKLDMANDCIPEQRAEAIKEFVERFLKIVHDNHYLLVDWCNSKDYGMFTIGIEQAVDETKKEMVGEAE